MIKLSEGNVGRLVAGVAMETVSCPFTSGRVPGRGGSTVFKTEVLMNGEKVFCCGKTTANSIHCTKSLRNVLKLQKFCLNMLGTGPKSLE